MAAKKLLLDVPVVLSEKQETGVINSFELGGVRAYHFYGDDCEQFIKAFGCVIDRAYFVYDSNERNYKKIFTYEGLSSLRSLYLEIPYSDEFVDLTKNKLLNNLKYSPILTELGFHFIGTVDDWIPYNDWNQTVSNLKSFTFHGSVTISALNKICISDARNLKNVDINIEENKSNKNALNPRRDQNGDAVAAAVTRLLYQSTLDTFKSNVVRQGFYRDQLAANQKQLQGMGFTLLPDRFLGVDSSEHIAQFNLKSLWFRTPAMEYITQFQFIPRVGAVTKLTLGGFPILSSQAIETTLTFLELFNGSLEHLSLFYLKEEIDITLLEKMMEGKNFLKVIELRCHEVSSIHRIFRNNPHLVVIIWFDQRVQMEKGLDYWYDMETLQNDGIYKVVQFKLKSGRSAPNKLRSTLFSYNSFVKKTLLPNWK